MKTVTFAELKEELREHFEYAHVGRVHITEDGEDKVVMLPYIVFEQMRQEFKPTVETAAQMGKDMAEDLRKAAMRKSHND